MYFLAEISLIIPNYTEIEYPSPTVHKTGEFLYKNRKNFAASLAFSKIIKPQ